MRALQIPKPQGAQLSFRGLRSRNQSHEVRMATNPKKESMFALVREYCKLTSEERSQFMAAVAAVNISEEVAKQSEAGTKAGITRKKNKAAAASAEAPLLTEKAGAGL